MKYIRKTAAMLTALTVLLPAAVSQTAVPAVSAAAAEETAAPPATAVPDWVPKNYGDVLKFRNEHGATYCADGYLLVLFTEKKTYSNEESNYVIDETSHCLERVMDKVFAPADFYPVDMELDLNVVDSQFHMAVFEAKAAGNTAVLHTDVRRDYGTVVSKSISQEEYTFTVGTDLSITETDVFGWLPDCISEITAQIEETGSPILTHDNYAAICIRTSVGTPGDWKRSYWGTNGDPKSLDDDYGNMELLGSVNCDTVSLDLIDGGMSYMVYLYQAKKDGPAHIAWQYAADDKVLDSIEFNYQIVGGAKYFLSPKDAFIQIVDADTKELVDMNTLQEDENGSKVYIELEHYVPVPEHGTPIKEGDVYDTEVTERFDLTENMSINSRIGDILTDIYVENLRVFTNDLRYRTNVKYVTDPCANGARLITVMLEYRPEGDINDDHTLSVADAVLLQKWLSGEEVLLFTWEKADFYHDGKLDARDLTRMLKTIANKPSTRAAHCDMIVEESYKGYGIAGQFLGDQKTYQYLTVYEGDEIYESLQHGLTKEKSESQMEMMIPLNPVFTVKAITKDGVQLTRAQNAPGEEKTVSCEYDTPNKDLFYSRFTVCDGMNSSYVILFSNFTRIDYFGEEGCIIG